MKYKDYEFTLDFICSICIKKANGERKFISGYLCRIYSKNDYYHEKVLDEFYITPRGIHVEGEYDEVEQAIKHIDDKYYIKEEQNEVEC